MPLYLQKAGDRRSTGTTTHSDPAHRLTQIVPISQEIRRSSMNNSLNNTNSYKPENPAPSRTDSIIAAGGAGQDVAAGGQQQANRMAPGGGFSFQNHDEKRLASARETRKISQGYGNQALRTSTIEQGLKVLTRQVCT